MSDIKYRFEKELDNNSELKELVVKYGINANSNIRPYGLLCALIDNNATNDDLHILTSNVYFANSLLSYENHWL